MTIWHMRLACWIIQATDTHSEHVILVAFPPQQWLHERRSMLPYRYSVCVVWPHTLLAGPHVLAAAVPFYIFTPTVHTTPHPIFHCLKLNTSILDTASSVLSFASVMVHIFI